MGLPVRPQVHRTGQTRRNLSPKIITDAVGYSPPSTGIGSSTASDVGDGQFSVPTTVPAGSFVRVSETDGTYVQADGSHINPVLGVVVANTSATKATVQRSGVVSDFANLVPGMRYFLGSDGTLIRPPFDDSLPQFVHQVGVAVSTTALLLDLQWPLFQRSAS
jgi:hypothetical protein